MSLYFNLSGKRKQTTGNDILLTDVFGLLKNIDRGIWLKSILNSLFSVNSWTLDQLEKANFKFFHKLKAKGKDSKNKSKGLDLSLMIESDTFILFFIIGSEIKNIINIIQLASLFAWKNKKDYYFISLSHQENEPEIISQLKDPNYFKKAVPDREDYLILANRIGWMNWDRLAFILSDSFNLFRKVEKKFVTDILNFLHRKNLAAVRYFAYGSNLNPKQMEKRAPGHNYIFNAKAKGHKMYFPQSSSLWEGGVASLQSSLGNEVQGVVYHVSSYDRKNLDYYEGVDKNMYYHQAIRVYDFGDNSHWVFTYLAHDEGKEYRPSRRYVENIINGGKHWGLDEQYLKKVGRFIT